MSVKNAEGEVLKAGCVVIDDGKVLLVTTQDRSLWAYPKGHAEPTETMEQVAVRETLEETGYKVKLIRQLNDLTYTNARTNEPIRVSMFLAEPVVRISINNDEISEWKSIDEAKNLVIDNLKPYLKT